MEDLLCLNLFGPSSSLAFWWLCRLSYLDSSHSFLPSTITNLGNFRKVPPSKQSKSPCGVGVLSSQKYLQIHQASQQTHPLPFLHIFHAIEDHSLRQWHSSVDHWGLYPDVSAIPQILPKGYGWRILRRSWDFVADFPTCIKWGEGCDYLIWCPLYF